MTDCQMFYVSPETLDATYGSVLKWITHWHTHFQTCHVFLTCLLLHWADVPEFHPRTHIFYQDLRLKRGASEHFGIGAHTSNTDYFSSICRAASSRDEDFWQSRLPTPRFSPCSPHSLHMRSQNWHEPQWQHRTDLRSVIQLWSRYSCEDTIRTHCTLIDFGTATALQMAATH